MATYWPYCLSPRPAQHHLGEVSSVSWVPPEGQDNSEGTTTPFPLWKLGVPLWGAPTQILHHRDCRGICAPSHWESDCARAGRDSQQPVHGSWQNLTRRTQVVMPARSYAHLQNQVRGGTLTQKLDEVQICLIKWGILLALERSLPTVTPVTAPTTVESAFQPHLTWRQMIAPGRCATLRQSSQVVGRQKWLTLDQSKYQQRGSPCYTQMEGLTHSSKPLLTGETGKKSLEQAFLSHLSKRTET